MFSLQPPRHIPTLPVAALGISNTCPRLAKADTGMLRLSIVRPGETCFRDFAGETGRQNPAHIVSPASKGHPVVRSRSFRSHHDRAFVPRRGVRPASGSMARPSRSRPHFMARPLDANGIVVDIGRAFDVLKAVLAPLNYRNLDDSVEVPRDKHHDRIRDQARVRRTRRSRVKADDSAATGANQRDSSDDRGVADGPCLVRGALVVREIVLAPPRLARPPTGGYAYDRRLIEALSALGCACRTSSMLGEGFPIPAQLDVPGALERLAAPPRGGAISCRRARPRRAAAR